MPDINPHGSDQGAHHPPPKKLSVELIELTHHFNGSHIKVGDLLDRFEGRVYSLLLVLLSLPFCQPIPLAGLSTPFGIVISLLGFRLALRKHPWLPQRIMKTEVPTKFFLGLLRASGRVLNWLERFLHPRYTFLFDRHVTLILCGLAIGISGILLLLPLPIPFSNTFPAISILLIAASLSERDGLTLALGALFFLLTLLFFALLYFGGVEVYDWLKAYTISKFSSGDIPPTP